MIGETFMDRVFAGKSFFRDIICYLPSNWIDVSEFDYDPEVIGLTWAEFAFMRKHFSFMHMSSIEEAIKKARELNVTANVVSNISCLQCFQLFPDYFLYAPEHAVIVAIEQCPNCSETQRWIFPAYYFDKDGGNLGSVYEKMDFVAEVNYYE